jgi:hypothetical protein
MTTSKILTLEIIVLALFLIGSPLSTLIISAQEDDGGKDSGGDDGGNDQIVQEGDDQTTNCNPYTQDYGSSVSQPGPDGDLRRLKKM